MITKLTLRNFKLHKATELTLSNFNLLTGPNGTGKSSILQALLLLRQSHQQKVLETGLFLNSDLVEIGTDADAFHQSARAEETLDIEIETNDLHRCVWKFAKDRSSDLLPLVESHDDSSLGLFGPQFHYLQAEHFPITEMNLRSQLIVKLRQQLSHKHGQGEYAVHFLAHYANQIEVLPLLRHPKAKTSRLKDQTDAWLGELSPGIETLVEELEAQNLVRLRYRYAIAEGEYTDPVKPANAGFGISYALPILVATLAARADSLLLIENPEAHLHPYGQAKLAQLLTQAAQAGVQILLETHSDHIVNGTLVAIKHALQGNTGVSPEKVRIYHFEKPPWVYQAEVRAVPIHQDGRVRRTPKGFFDQLGKDLRILVF
jgi:predicted ATPase